MTETANDQQSATTAGEASEFRAFEVYAVWCATAFLGFLSFGRDFGTDIDNYVGYLKDLQSADTALSLEPLYIVLAELGLAIGAGRTAIVELTAWATLALIASFCCRQTRPLFAFCIVMGWVLLQQIWGTIRMGLGIAFLLALNQEYLLKGRIPKLTLLAPIFHWSLLLHPFALLARCGVTVSASIAIVVYASVCAFGSVREVFFANVPASLEAIANYAALQSDATSRFPSPVPLLIHLVIIFCLARCCAPHEFRRYLGPLTILYVSTCIFFDFDQAGARVANLLVSIKILALIKIFDEASKICSVSIAVRLGVVSYSIAVGVQYYLANLEYFA